MPLLPAAISMQIRQIRNATLALEYGGTKFLIDPMLAPQNSMPGFAAPQTLTSAIRQFRCRKSMEEILDVDAVIVTHSHTDHWDQTAAENIPYRHSPSLNVN
jgi:L-ascorbate metabolism protein UlaG (beta-lactamase superfamily)